MGEGRETLSEYLTARGYILVEPLCPACNYGQLVKRGDGGRVTCTAYGQCEYAPG